MGEHTSLRFSEFFRRYAKESRTTLFSLPVASIRYEYGGKTSGTMSENVIHAVSGATAGMAAMVRISALILLCGVNARRP